MKLNYSIDVDENKNWVLFNIKDGIFSGTTIRMDRIDITIPRKNQTSTIPVMVRCTYSFESPNSDFSEEDLSKLDDAINKLIFDLLTGDDLEKYDNLKKLTVDGDYMLAPTINFNQA